MLDDNEKGDETVSSRQFSSDYPDWSCLLRELYAVREAIGRVNKSKAVIGFGEPAQKPVSAHLKRALDEGRLERTASLMRG